MEWEYMTLNKNYGDKNLINEDLNLLGSEGWEMVSILQTPPKKWGDEWIISATFKRPKKKQIL